MRLLTSRNSAEESITHLLTRGYELRLRLWRDYRQHVAAGKFDPAVDNARYRTHLNEWIADVQKGLRDVFPTPLELHRFSSHHAHMATTFGDVDQEFGRLYYDDIPMYTKRLEAILRDDIPRYTDLPIKERLFVEDVDSFSRVRDVNSSEVSDRLTGAGFLDVSEDFVQLSLEQILNVAFHKKDWGGEENDLYTANLLLNGARRASAFLLKGPGIGRKEMTIADCGKNGDQLVRLVSSPADLFIVQYVGPVSEMLVKDIGGKVLELRSKGKPAYYLIMDGQDTARVLRAYGKL